MKAAILFDLDGTLIDSAPQLHAAGNAELARLGADPIRLDEARRFVGDGAAAFVERMLAARGLGDDPRLIRHVLDGYLPRLARDFQLATLYQGASDALNRLAMAGHRMAVCTNKPETAARAALAHFGLSDYFQAVVGGDSLPQRKPAPEPATTCLDLLGGGSAFFVGDSEVDATTAHAAGMAFLHFSGGYHRGPLAGIVHRVRFDSYADLPGIVAGLETGAPEGRSV